MGSLGAIAAADQLGAHGAYDYGVGHAGKYHKVVAVPILDRSVH